MACRLLLFFLLALPTLSCHSNCATCPAGSSSQYDCTSCASGFYLQPNQLFCLSTCPSGLTKVDFSGTCQANETQVFGLTFNSPSIDWADYRSQSRVYAGRSAANSWDGAEPYYAPGKGLRFDGSQLLQVEGHPRLGSSFTVALWIYPEAAGTLIAQRSDSDEYVWTLGIDAGSEIRYTYKAVLSSYICSESIYCK